MKKQLLSMVAAGLVALAYSAGAAANLISNGSFELLNGSSSLASGYYESVNPGSPRIQGWTVTGQPANSVDIVREGPYGSSLDWAQSGEYGIDLAGTPGPAGIAQVVAGVTAGQQYLLEFWTSSNGPALTGAMSVRWGSQLLANALTNPIASPAQGNWVKHQFTVFGTGTANGNTLRFFSLVGGNAGVLIDNVSLTAVPLPPAALLFGSVLAALAVVARKRGSSTALLNA